MSGRAPFPNDPLRQDVVARALPPCSRGGKAIRLSYDHKAVDMNERIRIIEAGGFIMRDRVNGSLAITRALGDLPLKPYVTGHPFTTETALRPEDDVLILACDGVGCAWSFFRTPLRPAMLTGRRCCPGAAA